MPGVYEEGKGLPHPSVGFGLPSVEGTYLSNWCGTRFGLIVPSKTWKIRETLVCELKTREVLDRGVP